MEINAELKNLIRIASEVYKTGLTVLYRFSKKSQNFYKPPIVHGSLNYPIQFISELYNDHTLHSILKNRKSYFTEDAQKDPIITPSTTKSNNKLGAFCIRERIISSAGLFLKVDQEIVGLIFINYRQKTIFNEETMINFENYASFIAIAILNISNLYDKYISDASRSIGEITGRFAHTMKNDLGSIRLYIDGLLKTYDQDNENYFPLYESKKIIVEMNEKINNLLSLSKLNIHKKEKVCIRTIIKELQSEISTNIKINKMQLKVNIGNNLPILYVDPRYLKIALSNLADNSIFFTEENGTIKLSVYKKEETLFIEWSDTGQGIPKEAINKIFKIGYTTRLNGFGLGLFHAKTIIEEYGGNIYVDDKYKNGAKFIIRLPIR